MNRDSQVVTALESEFTNRRSDASANDTIMLVHFRTHKEMSSFFFFFFNVKFIRLPRRSEKGLEVLFKDKVLP